MEKIIEASLIGMIAGTAAGVVAVLVALPWKRDAQQPVLFRVAAPALLGAAFITALLAKEGVPKLFFPKESWWSLLHIAAVATVISTLGAALPKRWLVGTLLTVVVTAGGAAVALRTPTIIEQPWLWKAILGGIIIVGWCVLEPLARRHSGALVPFGMSIVFIACFALVLGRMGFARAAPGLAAAAAALGMITIGAWIKPAINVAPGTVTTSLALAAGTLLIVWMHTGYKDLGDTPGYAPILVGSSPVALWAAELPPMRKLPPWLRTCIAIVLVAVVAGGAVLVAMLTQEPDPYAGY